MCRQPAYRTAEQRHGVAAKREKSACSVQRQTAAGVPRRRSPNYLAPALSSRLQLGIKRGGSHAPPHSGSLTAVPQGVQASSLVPPAAPEGNETIAGQVTTASRLFKDYLFSLPMVQRPYDWDVDNALQLLDDLLDSLGPRTGQQVQVSELEQYMLGLITLADSAGSSNDEFSRKQIIDGQQRIVSLALILGAARERLKAAGDAGNKAAGKLADSLEERLYEGGDPATDLAEQPRIQLKSPADTNFLTNLLVNFEFMQQKTAAVALEGSSQPKLWANMQAIRKRMAEMDGELCMQLAKYILQKVVFIVTLSSSFHLALKVFKTSAQRGVDLMAVDLLKAYVFSGISPEKEVAYGDKWEEQEKALGREEGLSTVAKQLALIFLGRFSTVNSEFDDFEALFKAFAAELPPASAATAGEVFINHVWGPFCQAYSELMEADFRSWQGGSNQACRDASYLLRVLGRWSKKQDEWWGAVLVMLLLHRRRRLSDDALLACLADVERLLVCSVLSKWTPKKRKDRWLQVLRELGCGAGATYSLLQQQGAPASRPPSLELSPEEVQAVLLALEGPLYDSYTRDVPRLLLMRLNEFMLHRSNADYVTYEDKGRTQLTLEHVLPQKAEPGSEWAAAFGPEEHVHWVHRLGNLVLLASRKNSAAGMQPFRKKKEKYFYSGGASVTTAIPLTDSIQTIEEWSPEVLQQRQDYVLAPAQRCWQLHERAPC